MPSAIPDSNYKEYINKIVLSNKPVTSSSDDFTNEELKLLDKIPTDRKFLMKLVLIGDGAVGKTSIRYRYLGKGFRETYMITIGADFSSSPVFEFGSGTLQFQIWDLAGQPTFGSIRETYYLGAAGGLIVFDVTNQDSFNRIPDWIDELWRHNGKGPVPFLILGNKSDLRDEFVGLSIQDSEATNFTSKINAETSQKFGAKVSYLPTSALNGLNIDEAFNRIAISILLHNAHNEGFG